MTVLSHVMQQKKIVQKMVKKSAQITILCFLDKTAAASKQISLGIQAHQPRDHSMAV